MSWMMKGPSPLLSTHTQGKEGTRNNKYVMHSFGLFLQKDVVC